MARKGLDMWGPYPSTALHQASIQPTGREH